MRRRDVVIVGLCYAVLTAAMTWPYVNYRDFASATYGGDQRLIVWTLAWDNHAVLTGTPLFQSNVFYPAANSLQYNEHLFGVSLFTLPWAAAGASPVLAHHVTWWLAFPLNGIAAWLLIRRFTGDALASFAGSLVFTFSFYVMSHAHGHLHLIWLWPVPLGLLLFERWFDAPTLPRLLAWLGTTLVALLTSWYVAIFAVVSHALLAIVLIVSEWRAPGWGRRAWQFGLAALVCTACVYPFARHYGGIQSDPTEVVDNSADVEAYVVPPANSLVGHAWRARGSARPREIWGERTLFAGWLALGLGAAGGIVVLIRRPRTPRAWFLPALAVVAFVLSLGPSLPIIGRTALAPFNALAALPGLDGVRAPARFAAIFTLGLGALVAYAARALRERTGAAGSALVLLSMPLMLLEWRVVEFPAGKPRTMPIPPIYLSDEVRTARSLVSLPEYSDRSDWTRGGDYLLYSTAHWRPIVNGFGRAEPPGHDAVVDLVRRFPETAAQLRDIGLQYVIVHSARFPDQAADLLAATERCDECRLVRRFGPDYLFEIAGTQVSR